MRDGPRFSSGGPINSSSPYAEREQETLADIQIAWECRELCTEAAIERLVALGDPTVLIAFSAAVKAGR